MQQTIDFVRRAGIIIQPAANSFTPDMLLFFKLFLRFLYYTAYMISSSESVRPDITPNHGGEIALKTCSPLLTNDFKISYERPALPAPIPIAIL